MPELVIIGGGPAGLSAAIYAVRAGLAAHVLYKDDGALGKTDKIENYFGFPDVISGAELLARGRAQAERLGAQLHRTEVTGIEYADTGFTVKTTDGERHADAVLIARPFVTAVYGGGEEGVKCYIDKIAGELADTMQMCGAHSLSEITRDMVRV